MLTRAARRRQALLITHRTSHQTHLPWLCPALTVPRNVSTQRRATSTRSPSTASLRVALPSPRVRTLASAARINDDFDGGDEYLPLSYERHTPLMYGREPSANFDLSQLVMLDPTVMVPEERISWKRLGIKSTPSEVEAMLDACLQVQKWDRAFALLKPLTSAFATDLAKLQQIYNKVLEAMVFDLIWNRDSQNAERINTWIEVDMREAGLDPTAQTIALKIKVALATKAGSPRNRTVRRYWNMAQEYHFENEVVSMRHILSDSDLGALSEICPGNIELDLIPELVTRPGETIDSHQQPDNVDQYVGDAAQIFVRETEQKGLGLVTLRKALASFMDPTGPALPAETENMPEDQRRQLHLEHDSLAAAIARWKVEHEKRMKLGVNASMTKGRCGSLLWQWHNDIAEKIREELKLVEVAETTKDTSPAAQDRREYGPFLRLADPQKLAAVTALQVLNEMNKSGIAEKTKIVHLVLEVGRHVEYEAEAQRLEAQQIVRKAQSQNTSDDAGEQPESKKVKRLHSPLTGTQRHGLNWELATRAKVGALLCQMLFDVATMDATKIDEETGKSVTMPQMVFRKEHVIKSGRRTGYMGLLPDFAQLLVREPLAELIAKQLPMIAKPKPWTGFREGGYLQTRVDVLRIKNNDPIQRQYAIAAAGRGDLDKLFSGLDVLGSTPWKINRDVFRVMLEAWNKGDAVANIAPVNTTLCDIPKPAEDATNKEKWAYYSKIRADENSKSGLHSQRCFQNFQLETAKAFHDEVFYLPHNLDFRGRAYPLPPYLNQMGADNTRGLLLFAQGRELGDDGLNWLMIHLSNVFGYDKASLEGRAQFTRDHLDDIRDSVENPLTGRRWWLKAEDPWQCLAACHEVKRALESPDPSKFVSYLPVHQDGSCNGLQHYAALGGDVAGARQVNLEPSDKPSDVYTGVAELVKADVRRDLADGVELAKLVDGRITRKIVKQTVMTNVYGVTFAGALRQVKRQLDAAMPELVESGMSTKAASYIAKKIFKGLGTLFEGAHDIQFWLGDCAQRITHSISPAQLEKMTEKDYLSGVTKQSRTSKHATVADIDYRSTLVWTTPLRLPVVQPYKDAVVSITRTSLNGAMYLAETHATDLVNHRKQLQGFPPNFIHSLDATHMMLSALRSKASGLTFSAVHDSFWTHAADVGKMSALLREEFIRMHSEDIVGRLAAEFRARYRGHWYMARIDGKNPLAEAIRLYRSGMTEADDLIKELNIGGRHRAKFLQHFELVQEQKRARLLVSEDPAQRDEGRNMVTASSLFEKYCGEQYLSGASSLGQTSMSTGFQTDTRAVSEALEADDYVGDVDLHRALDPLAESDALLDEIDVDVESAKPSKTKKSARAAPKNVKHEWLWLPLTFRDVPKKGEFDVNRLRDSTYFFS